MNHSLPDALPEYREWLERVYSTYQSVTFCCLHRLHDRGLAERVGVRVVAGLVERPTIFQFSGLPYSGRIGTLAERWIIEAREGRLDRTSDWQCLLNELAAVPRSHQETFVAVCVWGREDVAVAAMLGGDENTARAQRESMLDFFANIGHRVISPRPPSGELSLLLGDER